MPNSRRSRWWLLGCVLILPMLFGITMLLPYPRQSLFGPTIRGKPHCVWEDVVRQHILGERPPETLPSKIVRWFRWNDGELRFDEGNDADLLPIYVNLLKEDSNPKLHWTILGYLRDRRYLHKPEALLVLWQCMNDPDPAIRVRAAEGIWHISNDEAIALELLHVLQGAEEVCRPDAMRLLKPICTKHPEMFQVVVYHVTDSNRLVRVEAMKTLGAFGSRSVPTLEAGLRDKDKWMAWSAANALREIGPEASSTFATMLHLIRTNQIREAENHYEAVLDAMHAVDRDRYWRVYLDMEEEAAKRPPH